MRREDALHDETAARLRIGKDDEFTLTGPPRPSDEDMITGLERGEHARPGDHDSSGDAEPPRDRGERLRPNVALFYLLAKVGIGARNGIFRLVAREALGAIEGAVQ